MKKLTKIIVEEALEFGSYNIGSAGRFGWTYITKQLFAIRKYLKKHRIDNLGVFYDDKTEDWTLMTVQ